MRGIKYYQNADYIIIGFAVTNRESSENIRI